jgi:tetratricopeptide (TPR) repeat protein
VWGDPIRVLEDNAAKSPGKARVIGNLAKAYLDRRRLDDARPLLQRALAADPGLIAAYHNLAFVHLQQGRPAEALPLLEEAARRQPASMQAQANLGTVCLELRDARCAAEHFRRAVELLGNEHPPSLQARVHESLGQALLAAGDPAAAEAEFTEALRLDPALGAAEAGRARAASALAEGASRPRR